MIAVDALCSLDEGFTTSTTSETLLQTPCSQTCHMPLAGKHEVTSHESTVGRHELTSYERIVERHERWQGELRRLLDRTSDKLSHILLGPATELDALETALHVSRLQPREVVHLTPPLRREFLQSILYYPSPHQQRPNARA